MGANVPSPLVVVIVVSASPFVCLCTRSLVRSLALDIIILTLRSSTNDRSKFTFRVHCLVVLSSILSLFMEVVISCFLFLSLAERM